jgi:hypothetical protein
VQLILLWARITSDFRAESEVSSARIFINGPETTCPRSPGANGLNGLNGSNLNGSNQTVRPNVSVNVVVNVSVNGLNGSNGSLELREPQMRVIGRLPTNSLSLQHEILHLPVPLLPDLWL